MGSALPHVQLAEELVSLDHGENLAKAAIQAIQQLLEERNRLRQQFGAKQDEIYALKAANEDLRRLVAEIHNYYLGTTSKFVAHLKEIEATLNQGEAIKPGLNGDDSLASLAKRFAPKPERGPMPTA